MWRGGRGWGAGRGGSAAGSFARVQPRTCLVVGRAGGMEQPASDVPVMFVFDPQGLARELSLRVCLASVCMLFKQ